MKIQISLIALLILILIGRFLPGPVAWGFNHLAYLPAWFLALWILGAAFLLWPAGRQKLTDGLAGRLPSTFFAARYTPAVLALLAGLLFVLFRERSFFMGDGYLVGELQDRGVKFRAFDSLDYLLHYQASQGLKKLRAGLSAFTVYRAGSILAGMLAVALHGILIRRLRWEPWRQTAVFLLLFFCGPAALYFGYVESYTYLFLFLTAFLISGLLVLEGRFPLWGAASFFGLAVSFHLTAVAMGPALLFLALRAPVRPASRRWIEAAAPPVALFALAVALHLAEGYNAFWFRKEFLESKNTQNLWIPLAGGRGLFSTYLWKDQLNLLLITAPACLVVVLAQIPQLRQRWGETRIQFLLVQMLPMPILSIVLDRKLGGARDWDLLAAHAGGLILLASLLLPVRAGDEEKGLAKTRRETPRPRTEPDPVLGMIVGTAFLLTVPWILLLHLEARSIARFVDVAADFPSFPRAYAYEEVGKYYRNAENMPKAREMYERCVRTYPGNPRFHVLLGSIYFMEQNLDAAEGAYSQALKQDPKNYMAIEMLGKVAVNRKDWKTAMGYFRRLVELRGMTASSWELLGFTAARVDSPQVVVRAFQKAMQLDPRMDYWHDIGMGYLSLRRHSEAVPAFREALRRKDTATGRLGLGWALIGSTEDDLRQGKPIQPGVLEEAERQVQAALGQSGIDRTSAAQLQERIQDLRSFSRR